MTSAVLGSTIARHQLASAAATFVDFGTMVLLVEAARLTPAASTLIGACLGAVVNFTLNRRHTFQGARSEAVPRQAIRYACVSAASAALNAGGEYVGTRVLGAPYFLVRAIVALGVGLAWNYPLHRFFVFRSFSKETGSAA